MSGWQDDPVVEDTAPAWAADPVVENKGPRVPLPSEFLPVIANSPAPPHNDTVSDKLMENTPTGRILDAFGQGFKHNFGSQPTLSPETEAAMRQHKVDGGILSSLRRSFNEVLFRPAATILDGTMRAANAVPGATGRAVGQVMNELGVTKLVGASDEKSRDDWENMFNIAPFATATELGVIARAPQMARTAAPAAETSVAEAGLLARADDLPPPPVKTMATDEGLAQPYKVFEAPESPVLDKAGNINLSRITAPEDVKNVIRQAAEESNNFVDARRGAMSLAETEALADASGIPTEALLKRKVGEAFNAEEAVQLRKAMVQSATEVRDLAAKAVSGSEADVLAFHEATTRHIAIQEQVAGMTAEAGRALSSFRIMAGAEGGVADVLKTFGGRESIADVARKINELDTPAKVSKFLMDSRKATTGDMLIEAWVNGLLSGPTTHVVNGISNLTTALWNIPETALAAGIGKLRGGAGERVLAGEAAQELFAITQGSKEGIIAAAKAYREEGVVGGQKIELARKAAIPSATVNIGGRSIELGGKQVRIPGRLLSASDEYFKAIGTRQELNRLAYRKATNEGLTGEARAARMANLIENPTDAMRAAAREKAEYQTFTNPLGEFGSALQKVQQSNKAARLVLTFIRTPVNIAKYTVRDRTVLGLLSGEVRANLASKDPIVRDTQLARLSLGTAVSVTAVGLAAQGLVTGGGPSDPKQRAALYATGWRPYSLRVGEMYYSYSRVEPLATLLGLTADMYDKSGDVGDAEGLDKLQASAGLVVASLSKNLAAKTSLTGLTDLVQAVEDPDRYGKQYLQKLAASAVPNVLAQTARMDDPYMREARTLVDQFKTRIPGLSETVAPRLDIWGQPIENQGSVGGITGIYQSEVNDDPVNRELVALEVSPAPPLRKIKGVELTDEQYDTYRMMAGRAAKSQLDAMVGTEGWSNMPAFARKEIIENTVRDSRQKAAGVMQMIYPELITKGVEARIQQIQGVAKTQTLP